LVLAVAAILPAIAEEAGSGIIIYSTMDHAQDEIAVAVPFVKADQHQLVTNVTTGDGQTFRVTKNQLKQIVRPTDLSRTSVVDEAGLGKLRSEASSLRSMQARYPRAKVALEPLATRLEGMIQAIESGNVVVSGRLLSRADYEKQMSASAPKTINLTVGGRTYAGARLSSVGEGVISIMHSGGAASVPVDQLSDEQIVQLNTTSSGRLIEKPKVVVVAELPPATTSESPEGNERSAETAVDKPTGRESSVEDAMPADQSVAFSAAVVPEAVKETRVPVSDEVDSDEPVNLGSLRSLLLDCQKDLATLLQGVSAMKDLESFPGGRYGQMKYDEATREANLQRARMDAGTRAHTSMFETLGRLPQALREASGIPPDVQEGITDLAETTETDLEEFLGVINFQGRIRALLVRLDAIAPVEAIEEASGSENNVPLVGNAAEASPDDISLSEHDPRPKAVERTNAVEAGDIIKSDPADVGFHLFPVRVLIGGVVMLVALLLGGGSVASVVIRRRHGIDGMPKWLWPSAGGSMVVAVLGGILAFHSDREGGIDVREAPTIIRFDPGVLSAAEGGDPEAQFQMGRWSSLRPDGESDQKLAVVWFRKAAEQGHAEAQFNLSGSYALGLGVEKDDELALEWLLRAGEQGYLEAEKALGAVYQLGTGLPNPVPSEAYRWTRRAAEQGDAVSQFNLAVLYLKGFGTTTSETNAVQWMNRSADAGYPPARQWLEQRGESENLTAELRYRFQQQVQENMRSRPQGANPFSAHPTTQRVPPQYREAERRAYEGLRQQGYSDEALRQQGYR
jgi:TPR repeat protein